MRPRMDIAFIHNTKAEPLLNPQGGCIALENAGSDEALPTRKSMCQQRAGGFAHITAPPERSRQPITEHGADPKPGKADDPNGAAIESDRKIRVASRLGAALERAIHSCMSASE